MLLYKIILLDWEEMFCCPFYVMSDKYPACVLPDTDRCYINISRYSYKNGHCFKIIKQYRLRLSKKIKTIKPGFTVSKFLLQLQRN